MFISIADLSIALYREVQELIARYSEATVLENCMTAESEIETYLCRRYNIRTELEKQGDSRHKLLLQIARDIAIYRLYQLSESIPQIRVKRYDDAIRLLKDIASGDITMPGVPAAESPEEGTPDAKMISYGGMKQRPPFYQ